MWCEVAGIAYSVKSRKCHVRYNSHSLMRRPICAVSSLSRAFCSSHSDNSLLLVELVDFWWVWARIVEKCVGNTVKQFEIMYLNWGKSTPYWWPVLLIWFTASVFCKSSTLFVPFSCGCCWFTETAAAQQRDVRLRAVWVFFWKSFPRNTSLFNAFFITNCIIRITIRVNV